MPALTSNNRSRFNEELVSVLIPAYNACAFIDETLDSVLKQTYPAIEVIVVDDGSTDETPALLRKYAGKINILSQPNLGQAVARNRAAQIANGTLFCFLDSDDLCDPEKIERQVALLKRFPDAVATYCDHRTIDASGVVLKESCATNGPRCSGNVLASLLYENSIVTPGLVLVRRNSWIRAGGFSEAEVHRGHEDGTFWLHLALRGPIVYSPETLLSYRQHPGQITRNHNTSLTLAESYATRLKEIAGAFGAIEAGSLKRYYLGRLLEAHLSASWFAKTNGHWRKATMYAQFAIRIAPYSIRAWRSLFGSLAAAFYWRAEGGNKVQMKIRETEAP